MSKDKLFLLNVISVVDRVFALCVNHLFAQNGNHVIALLPYVSLCLRLPLFSAIFSPLGSSYPSHAGKFTSRLPGNGEFARGTPAVVPA